MALCHVPPGLDATSTMQRVNVAVDLRPSSVQLDRIDSPLHQSLPATYESIHVNAHARMPYLRAVRSAHRIPASPYARATASRAQLLAASKAFIPTAPSPSAST